MEITIEHIDQLKKDKTPAGQNAYVDAVAMFTDQKHQEALKMLEEVKSYDVIRKIEDKLTFVFELVRDTHVMVSRRSWWMCF
jgi:hypothetical protein